MIVYFLMFYDKKLGWCLQRTSYQDILNVILNSSKIFYGFRVNMRDHKEVILPRPVSSIYYPNCINTYDYPSFNDKYYRISMFDVIQGELIRL